MIWRTGHWTSSRADFFFTSVPRSALGPPILSSGYWRLYLGVKWPECQSDLSPPSSKKVPWPLYAIMIWCINSKKMFQIKPSIWQRYIWSFSFQSLVVVIIIHFKFTLHMPSGKTKNSRMLLNSLYIRTRSMKCQIYQHKKKLCMSFVCLLPKYVNRNYKMN